MSRAFLVLGGTLAGVALVEVILLATGFRFTTLPTVQFGYPSPTEISTDYLPDRELLWVSKDYAGKLAAAHRAPPEVVFLGDSCTEISTYPDETMNRLRRHPLGLRRGLKLGVSGWSSQQGLWQLERDVMPLKPKVVTIYFGWNDHWIAYGVPDRDARPGRLAFWSSQHLRTAQLVSKARFVRNMRPQDQAENRVDLQAYRVNLERMAQFVKAAGGTPVLVTAPSNHVEGREPRFLRHRWLRRLSDLVPLHRSYVAATREAAARSGAVLCDTSAAIESAPDRDAYFMGDGIHFSSLGDQRIAELLAHCIATSAGSS